MTRSERFEAKTGILSWPAYLALCGVGLTLALAWLGPSASDGLGSVLSVIFWACHVGSALILLAACQVMLGRTGLLTALPEAAQVVASALLAATLFTPIALGIDAAFPDSGGADDPEEPFFMAGALEFAALSVPVVLSWLLINAPSLLSIERLGRSRTVETAPAGPDAETPLPEVEEPADDPLGELWSRIPGRLGHDLVALSAELHYLRVYTTHGETLVLFGFGRAMTLLDGRAGMQIHRSHWISLAHVDELVTAGDKVVCRMLNGLELPVSRTFRRPLREALKAAG